MTDASLARRATKGDQRAFAAIFNRHHQEIYRFCLSILGNAEDAREALQNTMLKALRALPGEKREIRLRPWLYRVAHNEAIDLVRKRRETVAVDPELAAPGDGLAETAVQRERLRQLLLDLGDLPDRQRAALVMRELGGLGFEEIAETFDTSVATARQAVYEARVNLRSLEEGREMSCEEVMHRLSNADGRVKRRRDLKAHLRACSDCRTFRDAIDTRRRDLAALAPLPAVASVGILHAIGAAQGAAGGATGASGATVAAGAGKAVSAGLVAKSAATVAVVAAIGVSTADRGGLVHIGLPGGSSDATPAAQPKQGPLDGSTSPSVEHSAASAGGTTVRDTGRTSGTSHQGSARSSRGEDAAPNSASGGKGHGEGAKEGPAPASQRGQETAAEHRKGATADHGEASKGHSQGRRGTSASHQSPAAAHRGHHGGHAKARGHSPSSHPKREPKPATPAPPKTHERPPNETTPDIEQSSGSGGKGAKPPRETKGMP